VRVPAAVWITDWDVWFCVAETDERRPYGVYASDWRKPSLSGNYEGMLFAGQRYILVPFSGDQM
jgi:hypothetical protein